MNSRKEYFKEYYKNNKADRDAYQQDYIKKNHNTVIAYRQKYRKTDAQREIAAKYQRKIRRIERESVIEHYGKKCNCCGEDKYEFLAIDHTNGGGNKHRKETGEGARFIKWIIKNNYPKEFRILCHNCN